MIFFFWLTKGVRRADIQQINYLKTYLLVTDKLNSSTWELDPRHLAG